MNERHPPKLATWLIEKLGCLQQNPPLYGDLLEEFRSGSRSNGWFWRQTAVVVANSLRRNAGRLVGEFAILFGIEALLECLLWDVRFSWYRPGNMETSTFVNIVLGTTFFMVRVFRKKALGALDPASALALYVAATPWFYVGFLGLFPNGMSLATRVSLDFVQLAVPFGVALLTVAPVQRQGADRIS